MAEFVLPDSPEDLLEAPSDDRFSLYGAEERDLCDLLDDFDGPLQLDVLDLMHVTTVLAW